MKGCPDVVVELVAVVLILVCGLPNIFPNSG